MKYFRPRFNNTIVCTKLTITYLNKVITTGASFNVKGQEVEGDHVALGLVNDPLTDLVVGIGVGVIGRVKLPSPRQSASTSWKVGELMTFTMNINDNS